MSIKETAIKASVSIGKDALEFILNDIVNNPEKYKNILPKKDPFRKEASRYVGEVYLDDFINSVTESMRNVDNLGSLVTSYFRARLEV